MPKGLMRILSVGLGVLIGLTVYGTHLVVTSRNTPIFSPEPLVGGLEFIDMQMPTDAKTVDPFTEAISVKITPLKEGGWQVESDGFCHSNGQAIQNMVCYRQKVVAVLREYRPFPWKGRYFIASGNGAINFWIPIPDNLVQSK